MKSTKANRSVWYLVILLLLFCSSGYTQSKTKRAVSGSSVISSTLTGFAAVSAGTEYTVGLKSDGSVACWGNNDDGQLNVPTPNSDFTAISGGLSHTAGLKRDGSVVCWGYNYSGRCTVPAPNSDFIAVSAGRDHTAGLKRDGSVVCWGSNSYGQCAVPTPNSEFIAISAGSNYTVGLKRDGSVVCWGYNYHGQCTVPTPNSDFISVAAGVIHTAGLKRDGSVVCWGSNSEDECIVPTPNIGFIAVSVDEYHSVGLKRDGSVVCWGSDSYGLRDVPAPNSDFIAVSTGYRHTVGLKRDGTIVCWGLNDFGEAPNMPAIAAISPASGTSGDGVTITGNHFEGTTAVAFNGINAAYSQDANTSISACVPVGATTGKITVTTPYGTTTSAEDFLVIHYNPPSITSFTPTNGKAGDVVNITGTNLEVVRVVAFNGAMSSFIVKSATSITATVPKHAVSGKISVTSSGGTASSVADFAVTPSSVLGGTVDSWGAIRTVPGELTGFASVDAGAGHTVGLKRDGSVVCWGNNTRYFPYMSEYWGDYSEYYGQCDVPTQDRDFSAISAGDYHSIGLKRDGSVVCWGENTNQECDVPAPNRSFLAVAAGYQHSVGLKDDGSVVCWGSNGMARFRYDIGMYEWSYVGQSTVPEPNSDFIAVSAGDYHTVGLKRNGSVVSWGSDSYGLRDVPSPNNDFIAVSAGAYHTVGLKRNGSVVCWGSNDSGQCMVPTPNSDFIAIAAGACHTVGLKRDGSVVCWGSNNSGQCMVPTPNIGFVSVAAGGSTSFGFKRDGSVVFWGGVPMINSEFTEIAAGDSHLVGLKRDGSVFCWGDNGYVPTSNSEFVAVAASGDTSIGLKRNGSIVGWGVGYDSQDDLPVPNSDFIAVSISAWLEYDFQYGNRYYSHAIGLKGGGSIVCWGDHRTGQCNVPEPNRDFIAVAAGWNHKVGLKGNGSIVCWGSNENGQLNVPAPNQDFIAIAGGDDHTVGLKRDGSIVCWGSNKYSQCTVPAPNSGFISISAGDRHSVGLKSDGSVVCWGLNDYGQCTEPVPNSNIIGIAAGGNMTVAIRSLRTLSGNSVLGNFVGDITNQQLTALISNRSNPYATHCLSLLPQADGKFSLSTYLQPPYDIWIGSPHFLSVKTGSVDPANSLNVELTNGDADGDNQVNLFDFVVLDQHFGSSDMMADLNGDGQVNLFDYVVIDQSFGARGEDLQFGQSVNPIDGAEMVWVPAGEFTMGSASGYANETPQRTVYLNGYWMYKYEVTVAQYRKFCTATQRTMPTAPSGGWKDSHPMVWVYWQDAVDYASWAGGSLPTEAQWEKAARGSDGRVYPWGNVWDVSKCANNSNSPTGTVPVGSYPSGVSPSGCMDMAGNVMEWCSDWYGSTYYQTAPNSNPPGPVSGTYRILRGGSWYYSNTNNFRCAYRFYTYPTDRNYNYGFRCVKMY